MVLLWVPPTQTCDFDRPIRLEVGSSRTNNHEPPSFEIRVEMQKLQEVKIIFSYLSSDYKNPPNCANNES